MLQRTIEQAINKHLNNPKSLKILFIWGPRRSGKTTLLQKIAKKHQLPIFNFDFYSEREKFTPHKHSLEKIASEHKIILIDEVQNHPESTLALKILNDEYQTKIIATGSSELRQLSKDFDSLAGRFTELFCLPLFIEEVVSNLSLKAYELKDFYSQLHEDACLFGLYPEVYLEKNEATKIDLLQKILNSYVLKDIIDIYNLKNAKLAKDILTKIALQIGSEVSVREIANSLQANVSTVANYLEIFLKNYILIALPSFKTNLRRSISELRKLYFYDLGIRNILVKDFRPLNLRPDKGGVFENFIVSELEKRRKVFNLQRTLYFYREYGGKEVDIVLEDYKKQYISAEIKLGREKVKDVFPLPHKLKIINQDNYFQKIKEVF